MTLAEWHKRPKEEAALFNPAFCGGLIFEFVKEYQKAKNTSVPFVLPFCALAIALHPKTRETLPSTTMTSLYSWLENHNEALVGYSERVRNLSPIVCEAIRFAMDRDVLSVANDGGLIIGKKRASFTPKFMKELTCDSTECINAAKMLGRWLPKAGSTATLLSGWGVKP